MKKSQGAGTLVWALLACAAGQMPAQSSSPVNGGQPQFSPRPRPHPSATAPAAGSTPAAAPYQSPASAPPAAPIPASSPSQLATQQDLHRREPVTDGGDPYYVLKPGDTVDVTFRYTPEFNDEVVIGPDGRASLKSTGTVRLAGRTLPELRRIVESNSSEKLVNPEVAVSLKDFERPSVVVAGEVQNPQKIELRKPTTVLQAILLAGGPKDDAALGRVLLFRKIDSDTAEVHVLQLGKYDGKTRAKNDLLLQPGDSILVRHDVLSRVERYVKLVNLGFYLNPFGSNGIF